MKRKIEFESRPAKKIKQSENGEEEEIYSLALKKASYSTSSDSSVGTILSDNEDSKDIENKMPDNLIFLEDYKDKNKIANLSKAMRNILEENFVIIDVAADGNCFFRALSVIISGNEDQHKLIRDLVCEYITRNRVQLLEFFPREQIDLWVLHQDNANLWADELAISAAAFYLDYTIEIYVPGYSQSQVFNPSRPEKIELFNTNRNHFEALLSKLKTQSIKKVNFECQKKKIENEIKIYSKPISVLIDNIYTFPKDGKSRYEDIYQYLVGKLLPKNMQISTESSTQDKTKKKKMIANFKYMCSQYNILIAELESFSDSRLTFYRKKDNKIYIVPYDFEIPDLIKEAHRFDSNHYDSRETKRKLQTLGVFWIGMRKRIDTILRGCSCKLLIVKRSAAKKCVMYRRIVSLKP